MYVFLYLGPVCTTLFTTDESLHDKLLTVAMLPAVILFFIETTQMRELGFEYFMGWNIVDFMQFFTFISLQYFTYGKDDAGLFIPELKLLLILMSFVKLLFFIRIFEAYGFLVQMIMYCIIDLIPFIMSYMIFLFIFSICFVVLNMEIDGEVDGAEGLNYFMKTML